MAIRNVQLAFETVWGVAAADGNQVAMPFTKFTAPRKLNRDQPPIITGTRDMFNETRKTKAEATWSAEMPMYFAISCYPLALHYGAPTVSTVFTSAKKHLFLPGGNTILSATIQWREVSSQNSTGEWYQTTGAMVKVVADSTDPNGIPMFKFDGISKYATNIAVPSTIATLAIEAYDHPNNAQFAFTKAGSLFPKATKLEFTSDQGYEGAWTLGSGVGISRVMLGGASATLKGTSFQDDYTGSIQETNDLTGLIASTGVILAWTGTDVIGTAGVPSATITGPLPYTDEVTSVDTNTDSAEDWALKFAHSSVLGATHKVEMVNMLAAAIYTGH